MRRCAVGAGSLAELAQRCPPARFPALRSGIGALVEGGGVSAPWQVYKEIERKDDELFKWARENREMFEKGGDEVVDLAAKLMKKHKKNGQQGRKRRKGGRVRCCTGPSHDRRQVRRGAGRSNGGWGWSLPNSSGRRIVWAEEHRDRRYDEGGGPGRVAPLAPLDALAGPQEPAFCRRWGFAPDEYLASPGRPAAASVRRQSPAQTASRCGAPMRLLRATGATA